MSDDTKRDESSDESTDALLADLSGRAAQSDAASQTPQEEEEEGGEDIEAFLASLEEGGDEGAGAPSSSPAAGQEPGGAGQPQQEQEEEEEEDPFASAFADLESDFGGDVEAEFAERGDPTAHLEELEHQTSQAEPERAAPADAVAEEDDLPEGVLAPTPEAQAPAQASESAEDEPVEEGSKKKKKKKKKKKEGVQVVEKVRSPGFKFIMAALKWTGLLLPAILVWWVSGAFLAHWLETGWLIAIAATVAAFVVPLIARLASGRGRWAWWACGFGVVGTVALVAPWPSTAGARLASYGHWPASAIGQLADWSPDNSLTGASALGAEFLGNQLAGLDPKARPAEALRLGTEDTLEQAAKEWDEARKKSEEQGAKDSAAGSEEGAEGSDEKGAEKREGADAKDAAANKKEDAPKQGDDSGAAASE